MPWTRSCALLRPPSSRCFWDPLRRNAGSSRRARQIGPPFENRIRVLLASRPCTARRRTRMRVPLRRHTQSRSLSCCGIRLPDRSNAPVVGRHQAAGQERLFAATIGTTGFHRTGRPLKTGGDLDCWTSCPLIGQMNGAPGRARTSCLRFRKPPLCPDELREPGAPEDAGARPCALRHGCIRALRARSSHRRALTRPGCGGLRRRIFVKRHLAWSCPGRVSAALGCVHLSANPQAV